ncbi:hypothetical protein KGQ90_03830 [Modicisalibacter tunisiensis]|uniref:hypothetical protein n=1 Tax=Modicisalibacter tunisiensis TaxID=390637 RepID=UPI001CCD1AD0|nr:hypothetical protein [Modicisalibacter tunisiensis]MBZ9538074.1 hypothetical protein [Modicisalibacter tunisiensis]
MSEGLPSPMSLLQEPLLGTAAGDALSMDALTEELSTACRDLARPLRRLCLGHETESMEGPHALSASALAVRLNDTLRALQSWALAQLPGEMTEPDVERLGDLWHLVAMAHSLSNVSGRPHPARLMHLMGLVALRLRLERHAGIPATLPLTLQESEERGLSVTEIAALCGLKLSTVRNALSRREMQYDRKAGVALDEALDWMVQRSGFLYPHINAASVERRINGRLAANWLTDNKNVVFERSISRLRLSVWRLTGNDRRFALNTEGVRSCVLLLPHMLIEEIIDLPLDEWEERGQDPSAAMHREALGLEQGVSLLQCQVPTLGCLEAIIRRLGQTGLADLPELAHDETL